MSCTDQRDRIGHSGATDSARRLGGARSTAPHSDSPKGGDKRDRYMKFALVEGKRREAEPNLSGECLFCGSPMVARCGEVRIWHWAHKGRRVCDPWRENETHWHRDWKNQFPVEWQEVAQHAEDGERHIADVKTGDGWVIELQHSYIQPSERRARDAFYSPKLIWVVDGLRRTRDVAQFGRAWREGAPVGARNSPVRRVFPDECRLLREWAGSAAHVFFDFGRENGLWWPFGKRSNGEVLVSRFSRAEFLEVHRGTASRKARAFDALVKDLGKLIANYESRWS